MARGDVIEALRKSIEVLRQETFRRCTVSLREDLKSILGLRASHK